VTTLISATVVDASGTVAGILDAYRKNLLEIRRQVTGNPDAVRSAGLAYRDGATSCGQVATEVRAMTEKVRRAWTGTAGTAYVNATQVLREHVYDVELTLDKQDTGMTRAAEALTRSSTAVNKVVVQFQQGATGQMRPEMEHEMTRVDPGRIDRLGDALFPRLFFDIGTERDIVYDKAGIIVGAHDQGITGAQVQTRLEAYTNAAHPVDGPATFTIDGRKITTYPWEGKR
jgi:uncharacterized protein YukE